MKGVILTYKEYYLKQHPESASIIDEIIKQRCPAEVVNCKYSITNQSDCFYQKAPPTADVEVICEACWDQQMEENIKEVKEKKNMTFKELWIALHPGEEFIHDDNYNYEGKCPCNFNYETEKWPCPVVGCKACWDREVPEETIEKFLGKKTIKTPKFKVGDRVKLTNPITVCFGAENMIGIVTDEASSNGLYGKEIFTPTINIKLENNGQIWCVNEDGCELINEIPALEKTTDDFPHFDDWTGKIIKLKSGKVYLVVSFDVAYYRNNALISPNGDIKISIGNLLPETIDGDKIVEIYKFAPIHATLSENLADLGTNQLLWKAKEKKKMSYEDIVAALGYEFELV